MSIRKGFAAIAIAIIFLLAGILYLIVLEVQNQSILAAAENEHLTSYKLADELRQSSDDLTRMARTYVVTGDPVFEEYFQTILDIRNGVVSRPEGYDRIYWDFVIASRQQPRADGEPVALQTLMREMRFTEHEFDMLRESQRKSDALVDLESRAMAAVKGLYPDEQGLYTVRGEPDLRLARDLLHGPAYHRAKAEIMAPVEEFIAMVETRTGRETEALRARARVLVGAALGMMGMTVGVIFLALFLLQRRVIRPTVELATAAHRTEQGNYGSRVPIRSQDEIGQLARAFNQMSSAIESDIATRDQSAAELALAREAADTANRAKSSFLANMSHELRTPMNAIIGYSEMLIEDADDADDSSTGDDLRKIRSAGRHLLSLINDVLDLSKIEAGKMDLFLENFSIPEMIDEVAATVETLIRKNGNQLVVEVDSSLGDIRNDITKVRQSLFNLLSNAAKFTRDGEIRLSIAKTSKDGADWILMSVSDSGIGIAPEKLNRVFDEFAQADETTSREYGGTGLGLAITRRFCRMMGGDIAVESTPGEGSTFTIQLPMNASTENSQDLVATPTAATFRSDDERVVLIIDDDPNALDLIGRTLQSAGVRVVTSSDGREALHLARSLQPSAITLDVMMPGMDGWEVLRELKADRATREIPVIMVTMTDDRARGYSLGATDFLTKPIDREQLVTLLGHHSEQGADRYALVVDDQEANRDLLRRALEGEGWQVAEAENGRVALERLAERTPTLILLDLMMPVMDGFEFILEMRKLDRSNSIPIVVVTAKDITEEDRRQLNGEVVGLIEKGGSDGETLLAKILDQIPPASPRIG